jgi:hypothetical protein
MPESLDTATIRPDVGRVLAGLKPFQRRSVEYVFDRLYGSDSTRRFLLADEVGLGKTLVARGVIARAIDNLWDTVGRIDVVYICSNHDIARQNINRLNITGKRDFALASRITLLPITHGGGKLRDQKMNFVSFTPGTSFDLKSSLGVSTERVLLYHLLAEPWSLAGAGPRNVLRGGCGAENFRRQLERFPHDYTIDPGMAELFLQHVGKEPRLRTEFAELSDHYHRADAALSVDISRRRGALVGELRATLARACLHALEPDLIILDEFQRFKHLLTDDVESEASQLAHDLFRYSNDHAQARVLMLSATPYKMYTMGHEAADDDHYADFLDTVRFLLDDSARVKVVEGLLAEYRRLLYRLGQDDAGEIDRVRAELQASLRRVMCRTERLAVTSDRSGMLREIPSTPTLAAADVASYLGLQGVARALAHHDTVEYWKSAPYLLSFMEDYALKRDLEDGGDNPAIVAAFEAAAGRPGVVLPWDALRSYAPVDACNPRMRELVRDTVDCGAWQALWVPPAIPYYNLTGALAGLAAGGFTKRLVFSSWKVVPKAIATLVSYEAERRMVKGHDTTARNTTEARKTVRPLLNFASSKGRLTGMPVLGLLYPSLFLAREFDPLRYMCEQPAGCRLDAADVVGLVEMGLAEALRPLIEHAPQSGPEDESWYWAAPILLDALADSAATQAWWDDPTLAGHWSGAEEEEGEAAIDEERNGDNDGAEDGESTLVGEASERSVGWAKHVDEGRQMLANWRTRLGRPPADLAEVVAQLAVAGPAVTALRAISRISGGLAHTGDPLRRHMAGRVAFGFRTLFNAPDVIALIRGQNGAEPYWRRVLEYCLSGCVQAVLDEYVHVLRESLGDATVEPALLVVDIGRAVAEALDLRIANPGADEIKVGSAGELVFDNQRLRARFAMRFGDEKNEEGKTVSRADQVRTAFNSPFWPFVLATTSVGQEGLDFHTYCHAVMHWNLPANPVDMEQREGRVHRYKGHAVRRNIARQHASALKHDDGAGDPWAQLFEMAVTASEDVSGLSPFWVYTTDGGAMIERHVPTLPLSRESEQLPALRNSLAVYRMVFGQPRQDDLVEFLLRQIPRETLTSRLNQLRIDLSPQTMSP